MGRLTDKDDLGNCCLKGLPWAGLFPGKVITRDMYERLYGALWKLMEYEDTGLSLDAVSALVDGFEDV